MPANAAVSDTTSPSVCAEQMPTLIYLIHEQEEIMMRLFSTLALADGLAGCVIASPYGGYGYEPAPAYESGPPGYYGGYAPGYYAAPTIDLGIGFGFFGGHGGHGGHGR
jgi:hypothetical protein